MHLSSRIIKARDVKLPDPLAGRTCSPSDSPRVNTGSKGQEHGQTDPHKKEQDRFIRGICHIPEKEAQVNPRENNRDISAEIEAIRKQAEEKIKTAEKAGYDSGFSEGLKQGIDQEKKELSLSAQSVVKLISELKNLKKELLEGSEKEIIDLAFLIAGKVIHKEVSTGRQVILSVLRDALKNIQEREGVKILVNPADYRHITEVTPDFLDSYSDIVIEKDEKIGQGGAMIETNSGAVDAGLDQQLNKIMESLCDEHGL